MAQKKDTHATIGPVCLRHLQEECDMLQEILDHQQFMVAPLEAQRTDLSTQLQTSQQDSEKEQLRNQLQRVENDLATVKENITRIKYRLKWIDNNFGEKLQAYAAE